jgi:hypothetical protein
VTPSVPPACDAGVTATIRFDCSAAAAATFALLPWLNEPGGDTDHARELYGPMCILCA